MRIRKSSLLIASVVALGLFAPLSIAPQAAYAASDITSPPASGTDTGADTGADASSDEAVAAPAASPDAPPPATASPSTPVDEATPPDAAATTPDAAETSPNAAPTAPVEVPSAPADPPSTPDAAPAAPAPAAPPVEASTVRDGVRVYNSGFVGVAPQISGGAPDCAATCRATDMALGLTDISSPTAAASNWTPASQAAIHVTAKDGAYSMPAVVSMNENTIFGSQITPDEYTAGGGLLFGFDQNWIQHSPNDAYAKTSSVVYATRLSDLTAPTGATWKTIKADVDWDSGPEPTATERTLWTSESHDSAYAFDGGNPGWSFSTPGTYCATFDYVYKTKTQKTPFIGSVSIERKATYTIIVGDLPENITTCTQPDDSSAPAAPTVVDRDHHDLRTYVGADNRFHWGLDAGLTPLSSLVIARTPPPATVGTPQSGASNFLAIGPVGTQYWYFPQTSSEGAGNYAWPGFSTESIAPSTLASKVSISLDGFSRNGVANPSDSRVLLLDSATDNPASSLLDSALPGPSAFTYAANVHAHDIWVFSQPGVYCVALTAGAKLANGSWASGSDQVTFVVGDDIDPTKVTPCSSGSTPSPVRSDRDESTVETHDMHVAKAETARIAPTLTSGGLDAVMVTQNRASDPRTVRDPEDVIVASTNYEERHEAWRLRTDMPGGLMLDTTRLRADALAGSQTVDVSLGAVDGPGTVSVVDSYGDATSISLSSAEGGNRTSAIDVPTGTQALDWYFSKAGVYCVPLTFSTTLADGSTTSTTKRLTVAVGNQDAGATDSVDLGTLTTCSRGQVGAAASKPGTDPGTGPGTDPGTGTVTHDDIYVPNASSTASGATILNDGHIDIASILENGAFTTRVKDTTMSSTPTWRNPAATVLQLLPESQTTIPDAPAYQFLGKSGQPIWQVQQTQQQGLLWPGWSTEALSADATQGGVAWDLNRVEGYPSAAGSPTSVGSFALYQQDSLGQPTVVFDTANGLPDRYVIGKHVHAHGTWAFSAEGVYCMSMTRSATAADGSELQHDFVLAVAVGRVKVKTVDPARCFSGKVPVGSGANAQATAQPDSADAAGPAASAAALPAKCSAQASGTAGTATADAPIVLSSGHIDYGTRLIDGKLRSLIKDGTTETTVWREPESTVLWLKPAAKITSPGGAFAFLGEAGSSAWQVPQTQSPGLIWLGWNTEELSSQDISSSVSWTLNSVSGPGTVSVYELSSFGAPELILSAGQTASIPAGVHAHGNWSFTAEGVYRLSFTQAATLADGSQQSDTRTLTIAVGDVDPSSLTAAASSPGQKSTGCGSSVPNILPADAVAAGSAPTAIADASGQWGAGDGQAGAFSSAGAAPLPAWILALLGLGGVLLVGGVSGGSVFLLMRRRIASS